MEHIAGARGLRPLDLAARSDDAAGDRQPTVNEQAHGDRCRVPAAGGKLLKEGMPRRRLVEMEGLRIELAGKGLDLARVQRIGPAGEFLADPEIVEIEKLSHASPSKRDGGGCARPRRDRERSGSRAAPGAGRWRGPRA